MSVTIKITTDIQPWIDNVQRDNGDIVETEDRETVDVFLNREWAELISDSRAEKPAPAKRVKRK